MEKHTRKQWQCNRCNKWNSIRKIHEPGEYLKTCQCGRTMKITVEIQKITKKIPIIIGLQDIWRRCNRGTPEKNNIPD